MRFSITAIPIYIAQFWTNFYPGVGFGPRIKAFLINPQVEFDDSIKWTLLKRRLCNEGAR